MMRLLETPAIDIGRDKIILHIALDKAEKRAIQRVLDKIGTTGQPDKFGVEIKRFRKKRSLDANSYYWVLVGEIAKAVGSTDAEIHNWLLMDYGEPERSSDGAPRCVLMPDGDYTREIEKHVRPTDLVERRDGVLYRWYIEMKGSRYYDTREMARLIDGTVYEAKALGIETMTPAELARMKASWNAACNNDHFRV